MFNFYKRRKFALTFAIESTNFTFIPDLEYLNMLNVSGAHYHIGVTATIVGKVNREVILATLEKEVSRCNDEQDKKIYEFLLNHAILIAWSPEE